MSKIKREKRSIVRLRLKNPLKVVISSIGSVVKYDLQTRDISENGFFLDFNEPGRFPFNLSSIMEVWLEIKEDSVIFFNGKMARVVNKDSIGKNDIGPGIGVKIIQIDHNFHQILKQYIEDTLEDKESNLKSVS